MVEVTATLKMARFAEGTLARLKNGRMTTPKSMVVYVTMVEKVTTYRQCV